MHEFGFVRVTTAVPKVAVANVERNLDEHLRLIEEHQASDLIVFPELSLTGYTCGDLFAQRRLTDESRQALDALCKKLGNVLAVVVVGLPLYVEARGSLYNCGAVLSNGRILGVVPKTYLPNYREFYESRWFVGASGGEPKIVDGLPFGTDLLFEQRPAGWKFGVEICEDVWAPIPPSTFQALAGATILVNLSASNETIGKSQFRRDFVQGQTGKLLAGYVYCSSGPTESTSDLVFGGHCLVGENGKILAESAPFIRDAHALTVDIDVDKLRHERATMPGTFGECAARNVREYRAIPFESSGGARRLDLRRSVAAHPFVPSDEATLKARCAEIFGIQCCGLAKRIERLPQKDVCIGVSGGLDSTLVLLVAVRAFDMLGLDRKHIHGFTMPGFGTSQRTKSNADKLMRLLGITAKTVDIRETALHTFSELNHVPFGMPVDIHAITAEELQHKLEALPNGSEDLTFENVQARIRTLFLMSSGFVLGTGDLSEAALGWSTYNADHMSMYNVNCSIPKTLVKFLVRYVAQNEIEYQGGPNRALCETLMDIVGTVISPELLPTKRGESPQSTEEKIGPYELHDFFLYHFQRNGFTPEKILYLASFATFDRAYSRQEIAMHMRTFITRFFANQFKRDCVPDGPKVGSVSLSPRGDWRMPSDADPNLWLGEVNR